MISIEFIIAAFLVGCIPGSGVIYTLSIALFNNKIKIVYAVLGCTLGIVPHIIVMLLSFSLFIEINIIQLEVLKYLGILYLLYLSWSIYNDKSSVNLKKSKEESNLKILIRGFTLNILNPKLSIFLLAFIPQFINYQFNMVQNLLTLSFIFMLITAFVFLVYGLFAYTIKDKLLSKSKNIKIIQSLFAFLFILISIELLVYKV